MSISTRLALDTNATIAILNGSLLPGDLPSSSELHLPVVVLGELFAGARRSTRVDQNLARIEELANLLNILSCDLSTARIYGEIEAALRKKGRPIPDNDAWIAAVTRQHGMTLVTRDAHFDNVDGLSILAW